MHIDFMRLFEEISITSVQEAVYLILSHILNPLPFIRVKASAFMFSLSLMHDIKFHYWLNGMKSTVPASSAASRSGSFGPRSAGFIPISVPKSKPISSYLSASFRYRILLSSRTTLRNFFHGNVFNGLHLPVLLTNNHFVGSVRVLSWIFSPYRFLIFSETLWRRKVSSRLSFGSSGITIFELEITLKCIPVEVNQVPSYLGKHRWILIR